MPDIFDLQEEVSRRLSKVTPTPLAWKWYPEREDLDLALALQPYHLSSTETASLVDGLAAKFPALATVSVDKGFLNLRFQNGAWAAFAASWSLDLSLFVERLGLPSSLANERIQWPYRWLLVIHEAHQLANLPGWPAAHGLKCAPTGEEIVLLKQLMALPGTLQQKGEPERKRHEMLKCIVQILQSLWKNPILTDTDPAGSAFRQALMRLAIAVGEAVGKPLSQSPEEGLHLPTWPPCPPVE